MAIYMPMVPEASIATPEGIQVALALPTTRSGKIVRRILRQVAEKDTDMERPFVQSWISGW